MSALIVLFKRSAFLSGYVSHIIPKNQYTVSEPTGSDALMSGRSCNCTAWIKVSALLNVIIGKAEQRWESRTTSVDVIGCPAQGGAGILFHLKRTCCAI